MISLQVLQTADHLRLTILGLQLEVRPCLPAHPPVHLDLDRVPRLSRHLPHGLVSLSKVPVLDDKSMLIISVILAL